MNVDELVSQLQEFGTVETGFGPKHPTAPSQDLTEDITSFLKRYPFVRQDTGYVEFLERYAGLLFWRDKDALTLSIYGFDANVSLHLTEGEGETITPEGFLTFADIAVPAAGDIQGIAFAFDATNNRRWGVYRCLSGQPCEWYCASFEEWLRILVALRSRWAPG